MAKNKNVQAIAEEETPIEVAEQDETKDDVVYAAEKPSKKQTNAEKSSKQPASKNAKAEKNSKNKKNSAKSAKPKRNRAKETVSELKKVSWPTFGTVIKNTGMVLAVVLIFGVVIFGIDSFFSWIIKLIMGIGE